jgi:isoquinoline 1-oxidoreductase subunit beta
MAAISHMSSDDNCVDAGVPIMAWRCVGNSHTEFARESALDELAFAAGRDPVDLRGELLASNPRTLRALELAAERAGWASPPAQRGAQQPERSAGCQH